MPTYFAPKPGRFGIQPVAFPSGRLNTGTLPTAGTQDHNVGSYPGRSYVNRAILCAETYPNVATSCTLQLFKMTGATALALTNAVNINNQTANVPIVMTMDATLTEAQRTITTGDSIRVRITTGGAPTGSGDDVTVVVELLVVE